MIDYMMSEKFGLDWQEYDSVRMQYLMAIATAYNKRDAGKSKQQKK